MKRGRPARRLVPAALIVSLGVALLVLEGVLIMDGIAARPPSPAIAQAPRPATHAELAALDVAPRRTKRPRRRARRAPRPVRVLIPAIGVDASVIPLGLDRTGALEVPENFGDTGWWTGGSRPGERGPAVIAGHVDSYTGPAVFFKIGKLRRGDAIAVQRADGSRVKFHVQRARHYAKARFPTAEVYGKTAGPTLRLITCSGTFDRASGHYLDNTVVYAS